MTFKDIDALHERPEGTASRNFRANRQYFREGVDYYKFNVDEIRRLKIMYLPKKAYQDIVFLTKTGYLMLVKSFTDKLAWAVQRELVTNYFKGVNEVKQNALPVPDEYEYYPKYWYNQLVVTLQDIEHFTGTPADTLAEYIKKYSGSFGADHWFLSGKELEHFLETNGRPYIGDQGYTCVLSKKGFERLRGVMKKVPTEMSCFQFDNPKTSKTISEVETKNKLISARKKLTTMEVLIDHYEQYMGTEFAKQFKGSAATLLANLLLDVHGFSEEVTR